MGTTNFDDIILDDLSATVSIKTILNGLSAAEAGVLDGITPGTVAASKAVVVDANKDIGTLRDVSLRGITATGAVTGVTDLTTTGNTILGNAAGDTVKFHGTAQAGTQSAFVADTSVTGSACTITSIQEATVDGSDPATTQALVNSLKIKYNAAQVDIVALQADVADLYTTINALNTLVLAMKSTQVVHGLMAAS